MDSIWRRCLSLLGIATAVAASAPEVRAGEGYRLIQVRPADQAIPAWAPHFPGFDEVIGYSELGHLFLRNPATGEYAVLHPFKKAAKNYGVYADIPAFESGLLQEPGFADYVLRLGHVGEIRKALGPLGAEEIYIPQPYPFLGGSEEVETYQKGNVWIFLEIVAQMQDL